MLEATTTERLIVIDASGADAGVLGKQPVPLTYLLGLSLLERMVHVARKAGYTRCLILGGAAAGTLRAHLAKRRVADGTTDRAAVRIDVVESTLAEALATVTETVTIVAVNQVLSPKLLEELEGLPVVPGRALVVATLEELTPIGRYSVEAAHAGAGAASLTELNARLRGFGRVDRALRGPHYQQTIVTRQDLRAADRQLCRTVYKPMDNFLARLNRKVSIPITRLLLPFPVTPNQVSVASLVISVLAGYLFAFNDYWIGLLAAYLSWFASMLDGVDGEIARFKHQESAFGCWLDTMADYAYYLLVFAGIVVGRYHASAGHGPFYVGAALLGLGAVASMAVSAWQRQVYAGDNPKEYAVRLDRLLAVLDRNPLVRWARPAHHLARRSVLPQVILLFALLDLVPVVFWICVVGANLYWILLLVTDRLLRRSLQAARS